jgi:hypothetical protein
VQGKAGTADFLAGASAELDAAFSKIEKSFLVNHGHAQPTPPPASKQQSISMKMDPLMDPTHLLFDQEVSRKARCGLKCVHTSSATGTPLSRSSKPAS